MTLEKIFYQRFATREQPQRIMLLANKFSLYRELIMIRAKSSFLSLFSLVLLCSAGTALASNDNEQFEFAVIGDTGYSPLGETRFTQLLDELNQQKQLKFVVHIGDVKGAQACTDEFFQSMKDKFNSSTNPFIYTPGDNDWTDCAQQAPVDSLNSALPLRDPINALDKIREFFFIQTDKKSLGQHTITMKRQSDEKHVTSSAFDNSKFAENQQWVRGNVMFITLHIVGSRDNCVMRTIPTSLATFPYDFNYGNQVLAGSLSAIPTSCTAEKTEREAANLAWLHEAFAKAKEDKLLGVVVLTQANLRFDLDDNNGSCSVGLSSANLATCQAFKNYRVALRNEAIDFAKPVALIQGDSHTLVLGEKPMSDVPNFTRTQTFGFLGNTSLDTGWVKVIVDPNKPDLFTFKCGGVIGGVCPV
jgi:hypothetical protein